MDGQRTDKKPEDAYDPLFYYRRKTDKVFIGSFLLGSVLFCSYLYSSLKEYNLVLFTVIIFFSVMFGFAISRLITALYSYVSKR